MLAASIAEIPSGIRDIDIEYEGNAMRIKSVTTSLLFFACLTSACANELEQDGYSCISSIDQKAELKTFLLPINLDNPYSDAELRLHHGDARFLAIGGLGITVPGLPSGGERLVCLYGTRVVDGITDVGGDGEYNRLAAKVRKYAIEYNRAIFEHLSARHNNDFPN